MEKENMAHGGFCLCIIIIKVAQIGQEQTNGMMPVPKALALGSILILGRAFSFILCSPPINSFLCSL